MSTREDLYEVLGVSKSANDDEIRKAYRKLCLTHHPDKGGDEEVFKRIKLAYEILSDFIRRKEYDKTGNISESRGTRSDALERIAQMLFNIVPNFSPEHDNLIAIMTNEVIGIKAGVMQNIDSCNKHLQKLNRVIERLSIKTEDENIILQFLEKHVELRKQENLEFKRRLEVCDVVIEILKDYEYGLISLPDM